MSFPFKEKYYENMCNLVNDYSKKMNRMPRVDALKICIWNILCILYPGSLCSTKIEEIETEDKIETPLERKLKDIYLVNGEIIVKRGPFAGMYYPEFESFGSSLWPKLAGVYEKELQSVIGETLNKEYKYILDIGCAEGYYSVGWALKNIAEEIYAYDIDPIARDLCTKMCLKNNVNINISDWCTPDTLLDFDFSSKKKRSLIMADCEGYERELFTENVVNNLNNVDMLIEVHDWNQCETTTLDYLISIFNKSHSYRIITGIDDYEKAYKYKIEELSEFDIKERYEILRENRRRLGKWIYFEAHSIG